MDLPSVPLTPWLALPLLPLQVVFPDTMSVDQLVPVVQMEPILVLQVPSLLLVLRDSTLPLINVLLVLEMSPLVPHMPSLHLVTPDIH